MMFTVLLCVYATVHRSRRTLESRQNMDDDRISMLEEELRKAKAIAVEAERNYEEVDCFLSRLLPTLTLSAIAYCAVFTLFGFPYSQGLV